MNKHIVKYDIGRSGRRYYFYESSDGSGRSLSQEDYEAIKAAFDNPILQHDFSKENK